MKINKIKKIEISGRSAVGSRTTYRAMTVDCGHSEHIGSSGRKMIVNINHRIVSYDFSHPYLPSSSLGFDPMVIILGGRTWPLLVRVPWKAVSAGWSGAGCVKK